MIEKVVVCRDGGTISFSGSFHYQLVENEDALNGSGELRDNAFFDHSGTLCIDFRIRSRNGGLYLGYPEDSEKVENEKVVKRVIEDIKSYDFPDRRDGLGKRAINALINHYKI